MMGRGDKESDGKLPVELVAPEAIEALAQVCAFGLGKYGPRNWEKGIPFMELYAAAQRHMLAWAKGENTNVESGLNHLDHAMWNLMALVAFTRRGAAFMLDDRPEYGARGLILVGEEKQ